MTGMWIIPEINKVGRKTEKVWEIKETSNYLHWRTRRKKDKIELLGSGPTLDYKQ